MRYREPAGTLGFWWEFGGRDALAIIQVDSAAAWAAPWLAGRQGEVLRFVADEVIRQQASSGRAELDVAAGTIVLRHGG